MTGIQCATETWNPTTGCDRVSPGCDHCYALTMAKRLKSMGQVKYQRDGDLRTSGPGFGLTVHPDTLELPMRWRKPRRVFVNSMSDLFHADVPEVFIARVWAVMAATPQHTYQILTKRYGRMRALLSRWADAGREPLVNVHLGISAEDQKHADLRMPALLDTPAAVRFVCAEPLLGPIHLTGTGLDWVIVGGESGPAARRCDPEWISSLVRQCQAAGVAVFVKQLGTVWARHNGMDHHGGNLAEWPEQIRIREYPR